MCKFQHDIPSIMLQWSVNFFSRRIFRLMFGVFFIILSLTFINLEFRGDRIAQPATGKDLYLTSPHCPGVLQKMTRGKWVPSGNQIQTELEEVITATYMQYGLPPSLQRDDGKCGNVSFHTGLFRDFNLRYFRAACYPNGEKACCKHGLCVSLTQEQCRCSDCLDLRNDLHAETSTWVPADDTCRPRHFSAQESCRLLKGGTIVVAGDSVMRQFYIAMVLLLSGNFRDGALSNNITDEMRERCSGMSQFFVKECRSHIVGHKNVCGGQVSLTFVPCPRVAYVDHLLIKIQNLLYRARSLVIMGIGQHDTFRYNLVRSTFLFPILDLLKSSGSSSPRLMWLSTHASGSLSFSAVRDETTVRRYNAEMSRVLSAMNVPVLDTYHMTKGVVSPDGVHFGQGVNMLKVQVLLNYINEQRLNYVL